MLLAGSIAFVQARLKEHHVRLADTVLFTAVDVFAIAIVVFAFGRERRGVTFGGGRLTDAGRSEWTAVPAIGVTFHARVWDGPGTPVVLVAGLGVSSRYWVRLGRRLGGRSGVLAPDLPGFGRTPPPPGSRWPAGPDVREQADQLVAWMDARGIARAVLVGHSVGCQTVVDVAVRFPGRVDRVVLAAPPFEPGRRSLRGEPAAAGGRGVVRGGVAAAAAGARVRDGRCRAGRPAGGPVDGLPDGAGAAGRSPCRRWSCTARGTRWSAGGGPGRWRGWCRGGRWW